MWCGGVLDGRVRSDGGFHVRAPHYQVNPVTPSTPHAPKSQSVSTHLKLLVVRGDLTDACAGQRIVHRRGAGVGRGRGERRAAALRRGGGARAGQAQRVPKAFGLPFLEALVHLVRAALGPRLVTLQLLDVLSCRRDVRLLRQGPLRRVEICLLMLQWNEPALHSGQGKTLDALGPTPNLISNPTQFIDPGAPAR